MSDNTDRLNSSVSLMLSSPAAGTSWTTLSFSGSIDDTFDISEVNSVDIALSAVGEERWVSVGVTIKERGRYECLSPEFETQRDYAVRYAMLSSVMTVSRSDQTGIDRSCRLLRIN